MWKKVWTKEDLSMASNFNPWNNDQVNLCS